MQGIDDLPVKHIGIERLSGRTGVLQRGPGGMFQIGDLLANVVVEGIGHYEFAQRALAFFDLVEQSLDVAQGLLKLGKVYTLHQFRGTLEVKFAARAEMLFTGPALYIDELDRKS